MLGHRVQIGRNPSLAVKNSRLSTDQGLGDAPFASSSYVVRGDGLPIDLALATSSCKFSAGQGNERRQCAYRTTSNAISA